MSWLQLRMRTSSGRAAALESLLLESGALSVTLLDAENEPLFEPGVGETPLWQQLVLMALFPASTEQAALQQILQGSLQKDDLPTVEFLLLEDQNWERAWLDDFKPLRFGSRLWVCPSWWHQDGKADQTADWQPSTEDALAWAERNRPLLDEMQQPGKAVILLDPGLAFGTGTHPTTSLCLQALDQRNLQGLTLVDYGCGSGILGLAALLLGAGKIHFVDNDPQALQATADNCAKNKIDPARYSLHLPGEYSRQLATGTTVASDGMLANILAGTLMELAEFLSLQVRSGGWILLSGILREQSAAVIENYRQWFTDFDMTAKEDWLSIGARRL